MTGFDLHPVLEFATNLKQNNNRPWFLEHKHEFETARGCFEKFIGALIAELSRTEPLDGITPKDCIFRLNRDLRFTKDKTPYKPYLSAYIAPGGRKSRLLGYYLHLEPGNVLIAGGLYEPSTRQLTAFREAISLDSGPFRQIMAQDIFRSFFGEIDGIRLKTIPRGYALDHPDADLLRLKSITATRRVTDSDALSPGFYEMVLETIHAMKPLLGYLNRFI